MLANILEYKSDYLVWREFASLEALIAYSREHPRDIVGLDDDPDCIYKAGAVVPAVKV